MTKRIRTFTVEAARLDLFISDCANCGVIFGMPVEIEERRREDHRTFYCPNGHSLSFSGPTQAEKDAAAAERKVAAVRALADEKGSGFPYVPVSDLHAVLDSDAPVAAPQPDAGVTEAQPGCTCGSPDTYSLNPAEVVVHRHDGQPCYIAPAEGGEADG